MLGSGAAVGLSHAQGEYFGPSPKQTENEKSRNQHNDKQRDGLREVVQFSIGVHLPP
jgi:hypothetical protein